MPMDTGAMRAELAGRYTLEEEVGAGGMAIVYRARDERHGRAVAIKVLRPELAALVGVERFLREIRIEAGLQHPHILPVLDSGEVAGVPFYVMPLMDGDNLRDRLKREGQLPVDEVVRIATEVGGALQHAHAHGIIHRDIKPDNILFADCHAVVADFGIARAVIEAGGERVTSSGLVLGTPGYMSPEQGTGADRVDARSDQYALACVVHEMLVGEPPFGGPTPQAIIARHAQAQPPHRR